MIFKYLTSLFFTLINALAATYLITSDGYFDSDLLRYYLLLHAISFYVLSGVFVFLITMKFWLRQ